MAEYSVILTQDLYDGEIILADNATYTLKVTPKLTRSDNVDYTGLVNYSYTWYKNNEELLYEFTDTLVVWESILGADAEYYVTVSILPVNNVGNLDFQNNSYYGATSFVTKFVLVGLYENAYFYNRDSSISSSYLYVKNLSVFKPIYGTSVSYSSRLNMLETVDNSLRAIPASENNLIIKYKLRFLFSENDDDILNRSENTAGNLLKTIEAAGGHKVLRFVDPSGFYEDMIGYVEEYSINKSSKNLTQIDLVLGSYFAVPVLNWKSSRILNLDEIKDSTTGYQPSYGKDFIQSRAYKKGDFVRISTDTVSNKLDTYWFINKDVPANSDFDLNYWSRDFIFETKLPFIFENKFDVKQLVYKNSFIENVKNKSNINTIKSYTLKFENITSVQAKGILFFLEKKSGYRRFRYNFPLFFKKEKVFICPQWDHTVNFYNSHTISMTFVEDPNGRSLLLDDLYPRITYEKVASKTIYARSSDFFCFQVSAKSQIPISYQWYKNDQPILNANCGTYCRSYVVNDEEGEYKVGISTKGLEEIFSNSAYITLIYKPIILRQPFPIDTQPTSLINKITLANFPESEFLYISLIKLNIVVQFLEKLGPTTYQWRKNGTIINGATSSLYYTPFLNYGQENDVYDVVLTNKNGTFYSNTVKPNVIFYKLPRRQGYATAPSGQIVIANSAGIKVKYLDSVVFKIFAFSPDATNRFLIKQNPANPVPFDDITVNGDTLTYTLNDIDENIDGNIYFYLYKNGNEYLLNRFNIYLTSSVVFLTHPQSQLKNLGDSVTFSVSIRYNQITYKNVTYNWYKNGINISGQHSSSYTINNITALDIAAYTVEVTITGYSSSQTLISNEAILNIRGVPPSIRFQPPSVIEVKATSIEEDIPYTFEVSAFGEGLKYQWKKNSYNILNATGSKYTISSITSVDQACYSVEIQDINNYILNTTQSCLYVFTNICLYNIQAINNYIATFGCKQTFVSCFSGSNISNINWYVRDDRIPTAPLVQLTGIPTNVSGTGLFITCYSCFYDDVNYKSPFYTYVSMVGNKFYTGTIEHKITDVNYKICDLYITNNINSYTGAVNINTVNILNNTSFTCMPDIVKTIKTPYAGNDFINFTLTPKSNSLLLCCPTNPIIYEWRVGNSQNTLISQDKITSNFYSYKITGLGDVYLKVFAENTTNNIGYNIYNNVSTLYQKISIIETPSIESFYQGFKIYKASTNAFICYESRENILCSIVTGYKNINSPYFDYCISGSGYAYAINKNYYLALNYNYKNPDYYQEFYKTFTINSTGNISFCFNKKIKINSNTGIKINLLKDCSILASICCYPTGTGLYIDSFQFDNVPYTGIFKNYYGSWAISVNDQLNINTCKTINNFQVCIYKCSCFLSNEVPNFDITPVFNRQNSVCFYPPFYIFNGSGDSYLCYNFGYIKNEIYYPPKAFYNTTEKICTSLTGSVIAFCSNSSNSNYNLYYYTKYDSISDYYLYSTTGDYFYSAYTGPYFIINSYLGYNFDTYKNFSYMQQCCVGLKTYVPNYEIDNITSYPYLQYSGINYFCEVTSPCEICFQMYFYCTGNSCGSYRIKTTTYPKEINNFSLIGDVKLYGTGINFCVSGNGWPFYFYLFSNTGLSGYSVNYHKLNIELDQVKCYCTGNYTGTYYNGQYFIVNYPYNLTGTFSGSVAKPAYIQLVGLQCSTISSCYRRRAASETFKHTGAYKSGLIGTFNPWTLNPACSNLYFTGIGAGTDIYNFINPYYETKNYYPALTGNFGYFIASQILY